MTVTAAHDTNAVDDEVTLTHTAASTDTDYEGLTLDMAVTVDDDDTPGTVGLVVSRSGLSLPEESVLVGNSGQSGDGVSPMAVITDRPSPPGTTRMAISFPASQSSLRIRRLTR